ncbi:MAG: bifunctional UDP-N-acetylglucosamine diphosphorylase/glucosamine-1-phosphate N-acetyltransferase GlmU [Clostridia bacterium]|nr:bifunctional UDP-N-acetylglucosamine diphosphorylase/glucosamine-1-phosphate N-acetyltransferase GlmU [Clostridia bacterium]
MRDFIGIILAAGMGKRMKSDLPKVLHRVCGRPLCQWVIEAAKKAGAREVVTVIGHKGEMVKESLEGKTEFAVQTEQLGTGHAVMQADAFIKKTSGYVLVLNGDTPLVTETTIQNAIAYHEEFGNAATVITAVLDDSTGYGRIVRNSAGDVTKIVEEKDADEDELDIREVNSGMYIFCVENLLFALEKLSPNNAQGEYYLTDTLEILIKHGERVGAYSIDDNDEIRGINDRIQLAQAEAIMQRRINERHMANGVTMIKPETVCIEAEVEIGQDTVIEQNVIIRGNTKIGKNVHIGANSQITNSVIYDVAEIVASVIIDSKVGEGTHVGPFAYLRPKSVIGKDVKIGDFVEIKNTTVGDGTKISHLTYVGDAIVGKGVNFGCGTVTVNYDGKNKYTTVIGDNAFIGCNTNLISPVIVHKNAYIAAGSTITDEVPENSLAIARSKQVIKTDWKDKRGGNK